MIAVASRTIRDTSSATVGTSWTRPRLMPAAQTPASPKQAPVQPTGPVTVESGVTVKDLSGALGVPMSQIIKILMGLGQMRTATQSLSDDEVDLIASEVQREVTIKHAADDEEPVTQPVRIPMPRPGDVLNPGDPADAAYGPVAVLAYDQQLGALGVRLGRPVPRSVNEVLRSPRAGDICRALHDAGVFTDYRGDALRIGPAPYLADAQIDEAMSRLGAVVRSL